MIRSIVLPACILLALSACTATKNVTQVEDANIEMLCIERNAQVEREGFYDTLAEQLEDMGIDTRSLEGAFADECPYRIHYNADWAWSYNMPPHVTFIHLWVTHHGLTVGSAEYNTGSSVSAVEKMGTTAGKLRPMLEELFARQQIKASREARASAD